MLGTFATDVEILSTAAFLKTNLYIFTDSGWTIYFSNVLGKHTTSFNVNVYLKHKHGHFYFVKNIN